MRNFLSLFVLAFALLPTRGMAASPQEYKECLESADERASFLLENVRLHPSVRFCIRQARVDARHKLDDYENKILPTIEKQSDLIKQCQKDAQCKGVDAQDIDFKTSFEWNCNLVRIKYSHMCKIDAPLQEAYTKPAYPKPHFIDLAKDITPGPNFRK